LNVLRGGCASLFFSCVFFRSSLHSGVRFRMLFHAERSLHSWVSPFCGHFPASLVFSPCLFAAPGCFVVLAGLVWFFGAPRIISPLFSVPGLLFLPLTLVRLVGFALDSPPRSACRCGTSAPVQLAHCPACFITPRGRMGNCRRLLLPSGISV